MRVIKVVPKDGRHVCVFVFVYATRATMLRAKRRYEQDTCKGGIAGASDKDQLATTYCLKQCMMDGVEDWLIATVFLNRKDYNFGILVHELYHAVEHLARHNSLILPDYLPAAAKDPEEAVAYNLELLVNTVLTEWDRMKRERRTKR